MTTTHEHKTVSGEVEAATRVLLFSGGLDSLCASRLWKPDVALYVDIGLPEQREELAVARSLPLPPGVELVVDDRLKLADQKLANEIVPMRNLFFVMIAAYYGSEVALAALHGDTTPDKDNEFAYWTETLLQHIFKFPDKSPASLRGQKFHVLLPFKDMTKTELVRRCIDSGMDPALLLKSRSCYLASDKECGHCRSCVRKFVALSNNRVPGAAVHFQEDPYAWLPAALEYARAKDRGRECLDIEAAMRV